MDDYGVPSSVEGRRYNVGLVSEWYDCGVDSHSFLALLKPGDLVEFKREAYCHWAVYIGDHTLPSLNTAGDDEDFLVLPCVVHRANPTDSENIQAMFSTSRSLAKGVHGIGAVVKEPLRDVWSRSEARINNGMDTTLTPFPSEIGQLSTEYGDHLSVFNCDSAVVQRALAVAHGERVESYSAYNVLSNNCEHFASWARCGWSVSCQVARRGGQVMKLAMLAGAAVLPRPISVLGN